MKGTAPTCDRRLRVWAGLGLGLAVVGLLIPLPNQYRHPWLMKVLDLGHVPLFFLITIGLWMVTGRRAVLAFGLAGLLAIVIEIAQGAMDRSGNFRDALWGLIGAALAVLILTTIKRPLTWKRIVIVATIAAFLLLWPFVDCVPVFVDAIHAYRSFPVLSDFQSRWEIQRWYLDNAHLERQTVGDSPPTWEGRLQLAPDAGGIILFPIIADWSAYRKLYCEFSFTGEPLQLLISVRDGKKVQPPARRFDLERSYPAGRHVVEVDLLDIAAGREFAPVDISRVQSFHLTASAVKQQRMMVINRIRLE